MLKLYDEVEQNCNRLQGDATRKMNMEIKEIEARCEGYVQGCEDMLEAVKEYMYFNKNEPQEGAKGDEEEVCKNRIAAGGISRSDNR